MIRIPIVLHEAACTCLKGLQMPCFLLRDREAPLRGVVNLLPLQEHVIYRLFPRCCGAESLKSLWC